MTDRDWGTVIWRGFILAALLANATAGMRVAAELARWSDVGAAILKHLANS